MVTTLNGSVTEWYPPSCDPVRNGVYECEETNKEDPYPLFRLFESGIWYMGAADPNGALGQARMFHIPILNGDERYWRGLRRSSNGDATE